MNAIDIYKQGKVEKIDDLWNKFDGWVTEDGRALAIVGMEAPSEHWMLVHETGTRIGVYDSNGKIRHMNRSSFAMGRHTRPTQIRLTPREVLRIRGMFHQ
jgi:hypothetical protein